MKIERAKLKKTSSKVPPHCKVFIERLKTCSDAELYEELSKTKIWTFGKHELSHWIDVLDRFDSILEFSCAKARENQWCLNCDGVGNSELRKLLLSVLQFSSLLVEHSFNRNFYNSMEHLAVLLSSGDMKIVLAVLNLLYVFSKRSHLIERLTLELRQRLLLRLLYLAESWGGKENGFGLAECCQNLPITAYPPTASTLHFEYYAPSDKTQKKGPKTVYVIHVDNVDKLPYETSSHIIEDIVKKYAVPEDKQMQLFSHLRLAHSFPDYTKRILCVQARLQAISCLVYCNDVPDKSDSYLYNGFIQELIEVLELQDDSLYDTKAVILKTLASVVHRDVIKLNTVIEATGVSSYHGFLPVLVRSCVQALTESKGIVPFPMPFATALFSFLFHLANATYESGRNALVSCGMLEALLKVVDWQSLETEHIAIAARAVRVIDFIRYIDKQSFIQAFQVHGGLATFIWRLEVEVNFCRGEQPFVIEPKLGTIDSKTHSDAATPSLSGSDEQASMEVDSEVPPSPSLISDFSPQTSSHVSASADTEINDSDVKDESIKECLPQRIAILKSMLSFLKKSIKDSDFSESIRQLMDGSLPQSLKHIISNPEYYGTSIFQLATDVVTVYVFQEPTLLSALQNNGLADVVLHALLVKKIPAKRRVIDSLPNVFSALCLNARGLQSFVACKPFEKLFKVLISPEYLPVMRVKRSSDSSSAVKLGNAVDELMRHQPSLRKDAIAAIIKLLEELCVMGRDPKCICSKPDAKPKPTMPPTRVADVASEAESSDDDNNDEDEDSVSSPAQEPALPLPTQVGTSDVSKDTEPKTSVPLVDYILNVVKFIEAILSNNSTDDHCREFVRQKGLVPLMSVLGLPNLPIDFPLTPICYAVSSVCKSILTLAYEPQVLKQGLLCLHETLQHLSPLQEHPHLPTGSVLLEELCIALGSNNPNISAHSTPLLHYMAIAHAYIIMLVHVCQTGQNDIRTILLSLWGSELGLNVLDGLGSLYISVVWESTVLLSMKTSGSKLPEESQSKGQKLVKGLPKPAKMDTDDASPQAQSEIGSNSITTAMEALNTNNTPAEDTDGVSNNASGDKTSSCNIADMVEQMNVEDDSPKIDEEALLSVTSRLGQALAELFGLLVKLCVGCSTRQRRFQQPTLPVPTSAAAHAVSTAVSQILVKGLSWEPPQDLEVEFSVPKLRLTFYVCSLGFTSSVLFDEKKYPYHLMLQKLYQREGFVHFFNMLRWALTEETENANLQDTISEFLDVWLMLLEKLVNPRTVLKSPYIVPKAPNKEKYPSFNPSFYLIHIHKLAFENILCYWLKKPLAVNGQRIAESLLTVICHLMKGETTIKERPTLSTEGVNEDHLTQLMNMGFSRGLASEALMNTSSLEQATEYLLNYPAIRSGSASGNAGASGMNWELSEEEQMLRAIAMSLGENAVVSTNQEESEQKELPFVPPEEEPFSTEKIDEFTSHVVEDCLNLANTLPDTVYRICDLLLSVTTRNGEEWRNKSLIDALLLQLQSEMDSTLQHLKSKRGTEGITGNESQFAVCLHLFTLIFEEMKISCATKIEERNIMPAVICLLELTALHMNVTLDKPAPKWLPFLILLVDQYEKAAVMSLRKAPLLLAPKRQWKWSDRRRIKWNNYSPVDNKLIDDAYKSGETSVRISIKGKKYRVCLTSMVQVNEETGRSRPIMLSTDCSDEKTKDGEEKNKGQVPISEEIAAEGVSNYEEVKNSDLKKLLTQSDTIKTIAKLTPQQCEKLVDVCVALLELHLDSNALHAVMRLCLQLTRDHVHAALFANLQGPRILLSLTEAYAFDGFTSLTVLLFRHVLEDSATLKYAMEKVIAAAAPAPSIRFAPKEMHNIFRILGPAACRDPDLFTSVASNILKLSSQTSTEREDVLTLTACLPKLQKTETLNDSEVASNLISTLLNALIVKPGEAPKAANVEAVEGNVSGEQPSTVNKQVPSSDLISDADDEELRVNEPVTQRRRRYKRSKKSKDKKSERTSCANTPVIKKSGICSLLAELVKSYPHCARLITDYSFHAGDSELISEDCTALTFILDNLLHSSQSVGDKETPLYAKVLIGALAAISSSSDVHTQLVLEIRSALSRALSLPESSEKHSRIQSLTEIIDVTVESCISASAGNPFSASPKISSGILKIFLEKGIVVDLARIPHCLDLSSPHMASTVNSALKPLERLSFMANLRSGNQSKRFKRNSSARDTGLESMEEGMDTVDAGVASRDSGNAVQDLVELDSAPTTDTPDPSRANLLQEPASSAATDNEYPTSADFNIDGSEQELVAVLDDMDDSEHELPIHLGQDDAQNSNIEMLGGFHVSRSYRDPTYADFVIDDVQMFDSSSSESETIPNQDDAEPEEAAEEEEEEEEEDDDEPDIEIEEEGAENAEELEAEEADDMAGTDDMHRNDFFQLLFQMDDSLGPSTGESHVVMGRPGVSGFSFRASGGHITYETSTPVVSARHSVQAVPTIHPLLTRHSGAMSSEHHTGAESFVSYQLRHRHRNSPPAAGSDWRHRQSNSVTNSSERHSNPPVILQRLLGSSAAQDILQLTSDSTSQPAETAHNRYSPFSYMFPDDDIFSPPEPPARSPVEALCSVPSTHTRWNEASRVLDRDSMHDCVAGLKPAILKCLEANRKDEISQQKESKKKQEVEEKKSIDQEICAILEGTAASDEGNDETEPASMDVTESCNQNESASIESSAENIDVLNQSTAQVAEVAMLEQSTGSPSTITTNPVSSDACPESSDHASSPTETPMDTGEVEVPIDVELSSNTRTLSASSDVECPDSSNEVITTISSENASTTNDVEVADSGSAASAVISNNPSEVPSASESSVPPDVTNILGGVEIPEGVDPSFLAALPDNIRQEVISEQLRLQRLRQRSQNASENQAGDGTAFTEVNPEFLAALPENIQEEVLAQQRAEQARLAAQPSNPDTPVDPTHFIQSLPRSLRQQVLADIDESLLPVLQPDIASEARALQRALEARRYQLHQHIFSSHMQSGRYASTLSRILRSARVSARYAIRIVTSGDQSSGRHAVQFSPRNKNDLIEKAVKLKGYFLLDHEALACLLVLLFVNEPHLHTQRLQRVLRNLCHHGSTRQWIIKSLLSILERTRDHPSSETQIDLYKAMGETTAAESQKRKSGSGSKGTHPSWLSITLDAALGCRTNVFRFGSHCQGNDKPSSETQKDPNVPAVTIHPLAAQSVCRHVIDTLISFSKHYPSFFLPKLDKDKKLKDSSSQKPAKNVTNTPSCSKSDTSSASSENDFWDVLVKLDSLHATSRKGKTILRNHSGSSIASSLSSVPDDESKNTGFASSSLAQLMGLLSHPVIKRSSELTDRLLKLLNYISLALVDPNSKTKSSTDFRQLIVEDNEATCISPFHVESVASGSKATDETAMLIEEDLPEELAVERYLKLVIEVLTSKKCSEAGLEDATSFLLRVSQSCLKTRETVLYLLLNGARQLGSVVCCNILALMHDLKYNSILGKGSKLDDKEAESDRKTPKGMIQDRFTSRAVVIAAPVLGGGGKELQLQSMQALTSKSSSQAFLLRILKVIAQLAESTKRLAEKSKTQSDTSDGSKGGQLALEPPAGKPQALTEGRPPLFDAEGTFNLSAELNLEKLWDSLSSCLSELAETQDNHAVLVLQPAVEAFFLVHGSSDKDKKKSNRPESQDVEIADISEMAPASPRSSVSSHSDQGHVSEFLSSSSLTSDTDKFLKFADTHRTVLNQILRQSTTPLAEGPFKVLVDHTRVLDFDVKRRYFREQLKRMGARSRHDGDIEVAVRREHVFEDSFNELHRRTPAEWKHNFYIVFEGEEGQDAGGLLREWYTIISREIFNPMYALFTTSPGDRVTYMINSSSHCNSNHLSYFKFVGRVIAKAVFDNKLLECYFTRSFYKHILGKHVKYTDMESEDYSFYQGLVFLLEHNVQELGSELTFSVEVQEFGVTNIRDLKPNGRNIPVTEEGKHEYVRLVCQEKMTGSIRQQLDAFLEGFYEIIPIDIISIFNEQELELLISGLPSIDIEDLKANTEYHKYQPNSLQIQWFWRALRSFDQADRAKFLQFVTGTSKVPLQGFAALEGMDGTQKFQIHKFDRTDRLPTAHTCFNQLDLPAYETYDKLRSMLLKAIQECSEGFGFA